ncbi:MAG: hypothetical protein M1814_005955 [Vezdaea aestivalis]|nr:MAG: hypothetical protein M1814_005955 [Vezdaea aestivalis]
MAGTGKLYPRNTVKKIVKAHTKKGVSANVDILIFLDYALFLQELVREASIHGKLAGERGVSARSVRKVTEVRKHELIYGFFKSSRVNGSIQDSLRRFKG